MISYFDALARGYVPVQECAQRMDTTVERIRHLVKCGHLRATADGTLVQPAILT
ncbi:hypothetical protein ACTXG5_21925 [Mycobacterium sp. Dal123C01]|uniref:hypothetical protein n=1 Tax=Mycobacterium sp. Dal123C01 TaxID=3457577 RepID=UPI00403E9701